MVASPVGTVNKGGRKRKAWELCGTDEFLPDETLRKAAQRWLKEKGILHKTLVSSSNQGRPTLIGQCARCADCTFAHCFSRGDD
eukprot:7308252-Lingulodinium_polyedra.AAC.1